MGSACQCASCGVGAHSYSDAFRHACEVRYVVSLPTRERRRAYVEGEGKVKGVLQIRGPLAAKRLRDDVVQAFKEREKRGELADA